MEHFEIGKYIQKQINNPNRGLKLMHYFNCPDENIIHFVK